MTDDWERLDEIGRIDGHYAAGGAMALRDGDVSFLITEARSALSRVRELTAENERLKDEYAKHMSHASGLIYDAEAERDRLAAAVQRLRQAITEYLAVDDDLVTYDCGNYSGMPWADSSRWEDATEKLRAALDGVQQNGTQQ